MKELKKFKAKHLHTGKIAEFKYKTIKEATFFNPGFIEWTEIEKEE